MEVTSVNLSTNTLTVTRGINGVTSAPFQGDPVFLYEDQRGQPRAVPSDAGAYEVNTTPPAAPSIASISPSSGPVWGGTTVTITGSNLGSLVWDSIHFGSVTGTIVSDTGNTVVATTPAGAVGQAAVMLSSPGGIVTAPTPFTYLPPVITSISPSSGPLWGGTTVTITGTYLGDANQATVQFGASSGTIVSDNGSTLVVTTPTGGPGPVRVTLSAEGSVATSPTEFTYVYTPTITVTTTSDAASHTGVSLRDASTGADIASAAGYPTTILFATTLSGSTITLTQGQLELSGSAAITIDASSLTSPVTINANSASRVLLIDSGVQAVLEGLAIEGGIPSSGNGGGVSSNGTLTVDACTIQNNKASAGGGIDSSGPLTITDSTISGNHAARGGGISSSGTFTLSHSTISYNSVGLVANDTCSGGGLDVSGDTTISDCTISYNSANDGGGIAGDAVVTDSTITNNSAGGDIDYGLGAGGGTTGGGSFTNCTFSYNTSDQGGGAVDGDFVNCTFYGNSAGFDPQVEPGLGGGAVSGTGVLINCTVTDNSASNCGGLNGTFTLVNTIVAGNSLTYSDGSGPDINGTIALGSANNLIGVDPSLGTPGNYGGFADTIPLLPGSPAIGTGGAFTAINPGINTTATTLTVVSGVPLAEGNFPIWIDSEELFVTGVSGDTITVIRGYGGTTAAAHNIGTLIYLATDERGTPSDSPPDIGAYQTKFGIVPPSSSSSETTTETTTSSSAPLVTVISLRTTTTKKHLVLSVLVTFSGTLNVGEANNTANYHLIVSGKKRVFSSKHSTVIKLSSAYYDAASRLVLLLAKKPFSSSKPVELVINGQPPSGLEDSNGRYIDGDGNGQPGGNVVSLLL
jgi:hypothetical protein